MRNLTLAALPLVILAAPSLAEPSCKSASGAVPMWQVAKAFEETGASIQQMKTTNGCYEIYGHANDRRVEVFYDPASGRELERE